MTTTDPKARLKNILAATSILFDCLDDQDARADQWVTDAINDLALVLGRHDIHNLLDACPLCWASKEDCECDYSTYREEAKEHSDPEDYGCTTWAQFDSALDFMVAHNGVIEDSDPCSKSTRDYYGRIWADFNLYRSHTES